MLESVTPKLFVPITIHSGGGRTTAIGQLRCWQTGTTPPSPLNRAAAYLKLGKYVSTGTWGKHTIC
jgi:hypothetical protein